MTRIGKKLQTTSNLANSPCSGRLSKLSTEATANAQGQRNNKWPDTVCGITVSSSTFLWSCKEKGWTLQQTTYQLTPDANRVKRLEFAQHILESGTLFTAWFLANVWCLSSSIGKLATGRSVSWQSGSRRQNIHYFTIFMVTMGNSRKYPYHTRDGFSEFRGQGGVLWTGIPKAWGDTYEWNSEGMVGGLDLGFTQATDKNLFLESSFLWTF